MSVSSAKHSAGRSLPRFGVAAMSCGRRNVRLPSSGWLTMGPQVKSDSTALEALLIEAQAKGSDKQFREWIQRQPSCVSGRFNEYVNGEGRCVAAHVRRAGESGTGYKGEYSCVPMTQAEHLQQHQKGESAFGGKEFFDGQR